MKAANDAKAKRGATKTKVITNTDVKKSKGKVGTTTLAPLPADETKPAPKLTSDQFYRARREAADRVTLSEKKVAELDKSLDLIEQSFYAENDPNYRDDVIQKRFEQRRSCMRNPKPRARPPTMAQPPTRQRPCLPSAMRSG